MFKYWLEQSGGLSAGQEAVAKLTTALAMAGIAFSVSALYATLVTPTTKEPDLVMRIESLGRALTTAAKTIDEIERAVNQRRELVDRLKQDADVASRLATLNREQADAVAQALRFQLEADQRTRFWVSVAQISNLPATRLGSR
jgi:hypothetical protein